MERLAQLVTGRPKLVLAVIGALVVAAGAYGHDAPSQLSPAGYEVVGSESTLAAEALAEDFGTGPANLVVLATTTDPAGVDGAEAIADGRRLERELAATADVADVNSYWATGADQLRSDDGASAIITARIVAEEEQVYDRAEAIRARFAGSFGSLDVGVGGSGAMNLEVVEESERDLIRAELIAIPPTTIIMLIVFRSVVAALLPLIVSAVAVGGTAAALKGLGEVSLVSIFALNLTTALGLGMGIDYSLFLLSRWREERANGRSPDDATQTALVVAGRPILFSGLTTAATLAALLLFDYPLLRSMAIAGFVVVVLAAIGALAALPAAMTLLGDRIDRWTVRRAAPKPVEHGRWYALAHRVMERPKITTAVTVGILLLLGAPFLRAQFGIPDDRALPTTAPSRQVAQELRTSFDAREFGALAAVANRWNDRFPTEADADRASDAYALEISAIDGVDRVETVTGLYVDGIRVGDAAVPDRFSSGPASSTGRWFAIIPGVEPISPAGEELVAAIRAIPAPTDVLLGGESARLVDNKAEIAAKLPFVLAWVLVAIGALLYRSFGSVLIPIKAIALNALSLTAAFGAIVSIFQDGRLSGLLGFTPTGLTDAQTPVLILCIAFGLSMDYEVFLLSRIKEEWETTGDTRRSVAVGLQRTGGIITAAAILMAVVFLAFATGRVTFIQMVGVGLALAIVMDATLVRSFLVPSFMVLAGRWNWWSPWGQPQPRPQLEQRASTRLLSVGASLPDEVVSNDDLAEILDTDDHWIVSRTGIRERRRGGTTTGLASEAAREALDRSGVDPERIDLVIVATQTPDDLCPSTAAGVQHALGLDCAAYDLNAACAGFSYGLVTAHAMIGTGMRAALVVGVDRMTAATNYEDRSTAILFGDGAGAVVLAADREHGGCPHGLLGWDLGTDGSRPDILKSGITDGRISGVEMNGKVLFKYMLGYAADAAKRAVDDAGLAFEDLRAVLAHQANQRILDAVADRLGLDRSLFVSVIATTGNTSAASVPLALDAAVASGTVSDGDPILLLGFGGGLSWAATVAIWR